MYLKNDSTGEISIYGVMQDGYSIPSQAELDIEVLKQAKIDRINASVEACDVFRNLGFVYLGNTFCFHAESDIINITMKGSLLSGAADEFKYDDINGVTVNFTDEAGMTLFRQTILTEWDRVIRQKAQYKKDINICTTIVGVNAISLDYNV